MRFVSPALAVIAVAAAAFVGSVSAVEPSTAPAGVVNVSPDEFEKVLKKDNVVVLDVRTPAEFDTGHLANAININVEDRNFADQVQKLDRSRTYAVYCHSGHRSAIACDTMSQSKFLHLYDLKGGIEAWKRADKPVVGATADP